jgi:hypothetical protein
MQRRLVTSLAGPRTGTKASGEDMLPLWRRTSTASGASRLVLDTPWNSGHPIEYLLVTSLTAARTRTKGLGKGMLPLCRERISIPSMRPRGSSS